MITRRELEPSLTGDGAVTLEQVTAHVRQWQADTLATVEALRESRHKVEQHASRLESPQAAVQLAEYFVDFLLGVAADLDRLLEGLSTGARREDALALRQLAAAAAAQEQRAVRFRDLWVNKPLPYEDMRPVLDRLSAAARDQLIDYRNLTQAAARLDELVTSAAGGGSESPPAGSSEAGSSGDAQGFDRRALFTRFIPKTGPDEKA
jgi:hypothetical protein